MKYGSWTDSVSESKKCSGWTGEETKSAECEMKDMDAEIYMIFIFEFYKGNKIPKTLAYKYQSIKA